MTRREGFAGSIAVVLALLVFDATDAGAQRALPLMGADSSTLRREPIIRPAALGADPVTGLRYGDPAERMDLVKPPTADNSGDATVQIPITIPPGRGGVQPDLTLSYDSSNAAGWLGTGWDLNVGEVTVDTRFGVPHYYPDKESESYTLDGAPLSPSAVRTELEDREGDRADFTRRIDAKQELIIRHGDHPSNYWWEVRDKNGAIRWYGGYPDIGGPDGDRYTDHRAGLDPNAVLRDGNDNIYRWALSASRDVGVNMVRYFYENVAGGRVGDAATLGRQLYLKRIQYTSSSPKQRDPSEPEYPEDPAYEVRLLRDGDINPRPAQRKDVVVDGTGGLLEVTSDLLRRIEVYYGKPNPDPDNSDPMFNRPRSYDVRARRFDLDYAEGAFGKSLLRAVKQVDRNGDVFASNTLSYYDDIRDPAGNYDGFGDEHGWDTQKDDLTADLLSSFGTSALGASETNAGDVAAFLGFGLTPGKTVAIGASVTINGGATEGVAEFLDINGDGLPDKVYRDGFRGPVKFRLNHSGPTGGTSFQTGSGTGVPDLDNLSTEFDIGVGAAVEAYVGGSVQFSVGANVAIGEEYFEDANDDALPDFVSAGKVYFNHLDEDGVPTFDSDSSQTRVPVGTRDVEADDIEEIDDLEADQRASSPLQDTVRRWVAPYTGRVEIDAPVTFDPPPDTRVPRVPAYDGDGLRVAVQRGGDELWAARLENPGESATPTGVADIAVVRGQAVYFRVQSVDHGVLDQVRWDPRIIYREFAHGDDAPPTDVNGLSQRTFQASDDFTLAGRPGTTLIMPLQGRVHFDALLRKTRPTSDDVRAIVTRNGVPIVDRLIRHDEVFPDGIDLSTDFNVSAPTDTTADRVVVRLEVDSPIDVTALQWKPRLYYTSATSEGQTVPVVDRNGKPTIEIVISPDIDIYPANSATGPTQPWEASTSTDLNVSAEITTEEDTPATDAVLTVKRRNELVAKKAFRIPAAVAGQPATVTIEDVNFLEDADFWFDITVRDPVAASRITSSVVKLPQVGMDGTPLPHTLNETGMQGIFPVSYRGWGYAGYDGGGARATAPIDEESFKFRRADFSEEPPTSYDDPDFENQRHPKAYPFIPFDLQLLDENSTPIGSAPVWRGAKDNLVGGVTFARSSRRGVDNPEAVKQPDAEVADVGGAGVRAVRRVGITAPTFSLFGGAFGFGGSFGGGMSFGLLDYVDMNGDAFPDIVAPGHIKYTGPRGGYQHRGSGVGVVGQDTTIGVGGGFSGSAIDLKANSKGDNATPQDTSASSKRKTRAQKAAAAGSDATGTTRGFDLGGSFGLEAEFTNPTAPADNWPMGELSLGATLEQELADVNGDGLPDKITVDAGSVDVELNLGYSFGPKIEWAGGGFEVGESYAGSLGVALGFQYNKMEFAGGLSYNEGVDMARFSWIDINGDAILDRVRKTGVDDVRVAFGSGGGLLDDEIDYGDMLDGSIDLVGQDIPIGPQIAQGRSRGLGGGFDFTISIGPLCTFFCYIVVNPGVHFDHSVSNSVVQTLDINGDGYPDSLRSNEDDNVDVKLNKTGRTNLLRSIKNSLGGEIRLGYDRAGNTVRQPDSQWVLASVQVDDGRSGDGADTLLRTFEYSDNEYNPLERELLGYGKVVERQREDSGDGDVSDDPLLRSVERRYRNGSVYESGLVTSEKLVTPGGTPLKETKMTWEIVDQDDDRPLDLDPAGDPAGVSLLGVSGAPRRTKVEQLWYDGDGNVRQSTHNSFEYDELGNVVRQVDVGEPEDPSDDLIATTTPTNCTFASDLPHEGDPDPEVGPPVTGFPCPATKPAGRISPLWSPTRCSTWTSLPARFEVRDGAGKLLRKRQGAKALCDNSSVIHLVEDVDADATAVTDLDYDPWGSYADITYPENADGERLRVNYVYDANNFANVGLTTDNHGPDNEDGTTGGLEGEATFDGATGRIASRTDPNGATTTYGYDDAGRLKWIKGPKEQDNDDCDDEDQAGCTVAFEYHVGADGYPHVIASHFDAENADGRIETVAFADGIGRVTQTKRDATVFRGAGSDAENVMTVSGAIEYDALGRPVKQWNPTEGPRSRKGVFETGRPPEVTTTTLNLADRVTKLRKPDNTETKTDYEFGGGELGATLFATTVTDAKGKPRRSFTDVRDNLRAVDDGLPARRTRYRYDALGQLTQSIGTGGATSAYTYDLLGRRTSTRTPDGGLVEQRYDAASNLVAKITPKLRAAGQQITYAYDHERLTKIDHPAGTHDVTYDWGAKDDTENGAGRVVEVHDGARDQTMGYDKMGVVDAQKATMRVHNLGDATGTRSTYETTFNYDWLGRVREMQYPDGEKLTYDYDSGGLVKRVEGEKAGRRYGYLDRLEYDEFLGKRFQKTANGVTTSYAYDHRTRRLTRQNTNTPAREVQDLNYSYDLVGNVTKLDNQLPPAVPELFGGPGAQNYRYDAYHRLSSADGTYQMAPGKTREYTFSNTHDAHGNLLVKKQTDGIRGSNGKLNPLAPTTYELNPITYRTDNAHQIAKIAKRSYTYDANGNLTGWTEDKTGQNRKLTWDAADRMTSVADQGSTTTYTYGADNDLAFERGPGGETAFVNGWYTVRNGSERIKHVWVGRDRLASQRAVDDGSYEAKRYFVHKDLQGSTNIVSANDALVFQHYEHFPAGEAWVREESTDNRTPYHYAGGYLDEVRNLTNLGARWYEPREQLFTSQDPLLTDNPLATIGDPALLPGYAYAQSNPVRLVDRTGRSPGPVLEAFFTAIGQVLHPADPMAVVKANAERVQGSAERSAKFWADVRQQDASAGGSGDASSQALVVADERSVGLPKAVEREPGFEKLFAFADILDSKPLVSFEFEQTKGGPWGLVGATFSPGLIKEFDIPGLTPSDAAADETAAAPEPADAGADAKRRKKTR